MACRRSGVRAPLAPSVRKARLGGSFCVLAPAPSLVRKAALETEWKRAVCKAGRRALEQGEDQPASLSCGGLGAQAGIEPASRSRTVAAMRATCPGYLRSSVA